MGERKDQVGDTQKVLKEMQELIKLKQFAERLANPYEHLHSAPARMREWKKLTNV
jgi:hypothetical protein